MATQKDKYPQKRQQFLERTMLALSVDAIRAETLLTLPRRQSIRINTLKTTHAQAVKELSTVAEHIAPIEWFKDGVTVEDSKVVRDQPFITNGEGYIQNAASWLPVIVLDPKPGETVLDICAAPGGKTSHIAQMADNQAMITANDNSRARLHKLRANMERLGVKNINYSLFDGTQLARRLENQQFNRILLDAPCSGEGMMHLDNRKDFSSWSVAHVKRLQSLQKKLIAQAWQLLEPGGTLVYSTCTIAPEENEAVVDYFLRRFDDAQLVAIPLKKKLANSVAPVLTWNGKSYDPRITQTLRLAPSETVEAFYVAKFTKAPAV